MKVFATYAIACILMMVAASDGSSYATCDDANSEDVTSVINSTVDRLMQLRHPNWGWTNTPEVVLGIQLSAQDKFFGRQKALERMKAEIDETIDSMNIGKLALYIMSIQASCEDPHNFGGHELVHILSKRIRHQFFYNGTTNIIPYDRYYRFGLALGALCVSNEKSRPSIRRLLKGQNEDGSFGATHSVDDSAQVLLALKCVQGGCGVRSFLRKKVGAAIEKLAAFLQSKILEDGSNVWIGNKYASPSAALALAEASDEDPENWQCEDIMESLAVDPQSSDQEGALSQRLPALSGVSYLDLKFSNWQCETEVPIPPGYEPTCDPKNPTTCNPFGPTTGAPTATIEVRLTIYTEKPPAVGTVPNADAYTNVPTGSTLLFAMTQAQNEGKITFETTSTSWGESVRSMQNVTVDSNAREYWALINGATGDLLPQGVSSYIPADGEQTVFRVKTW